MSDVSQDEIDALLSGGGPGPEKPKEQAVEQKTATVTASGDYKRYDFRSPNQIPNDQKAALTEIHRSYARAISLSLSGFLRSDVDFHLERVEQSSFSEYVKSLVNPTTVATFEMHPLAGFGCIEVNAPIIYSCIDRMLGGDGKLPDVGRTFTNIELAIVRRVLDLCLRELSAAWGKLLAIHFTLHDMVTNPSLVHNIPLREACVVVTCKAVMGETTGLVTLCIPYVSIEPVAKKLGCNDAVELSPQLLRRMQTLNQSNLEKVPVEIDVSLAHLALTMQELMALSVGDILDIGQKIKEPVVMKINGVSKFKVTPGLNGKFKAALIEDMCKEE